MRCLKLRDDNLKRIVRDHVDNSTGNDILRRVICNIINTRKNSFEQLSQLIFDTLLIQNYSVNSLPVIRNNIIRHIVSEKPMTYHVFEFMMTMVFKEKIPDDPEIEHKCLLGSTGRAVDYRGKRVGRLKVLNIIGRDEANDIVWLCRCECGNELSVKSVYLKMRTVRSCGCLAKELAGNRLRTHGMTKTREFKTWDSMKQRCYNPNSKHYPDYGARGIKVCDRWLESFENFYDDMSEKPEGMSIDRIDVNLDYEPDNCKWSTTKEQNNNMRHTLRFDDGTPIGTFASDNNISYHNVLRWLNRGLTKHDMIAKHEKIGSNSCIFDDEMTLIEFCNKYGLVYSSAYKFFKQGFTKEEILAKFKPTLINS